MKARTQLPGNKGFAACAAEAETESLVLGECQALGETLSWDPKEQHQCSHLIYWGRGEQTDTEIHIHFYTHIQIHMLSHSYSLPLPLLSIPLPILPEKERHLGICRILHWFSLENSASKCHRQHRALDFSLTIAL